MKNIELFVEFNYLITRVTGLPGLVLKNIGEKIGKVFQKCRRNIGYTQNRKNIGT